VHYELKYISYMYIHIYIIVSLWVVTQSKIVKPLDVDLYGSCAGKYE
jgi:hypothetical protein